MRWASKRQYRRSGDRRTISGFLLLPRCINGEWRWLEVASIRQVYRTHSSAMDGFEAWWEDVAWVEVTC